MPKRFTIDEARSLLPRVGRYIQEAVAMKREYQEAERMLEAHSTQIMMMGGMQVDRERIGKMKSQRDASAERVKEAIRQIQDVGCEVKDLDIGLIDFPTLFRGEEVYLCWKLGEADIAYWHGLHEGFAGRKPIDQDFLQNHQGDRPH